MNEIDDPLRAYRPAGPPPDLRARILRAADVTRQVRLLDWLPALAAVALIVLLHVVASGIRDRVYDQIAPPDLPTPIAVTSR